MAEELADPADEESTEEGEDDTVLQLWKLLPQLKDMPEAFL